MAKKIIIGVSVLIVLIIAISAFMLMSEYNRTTSGKETVKVTIPQGASEKEIATILKENGVIDYEITFRLKMTNSPYRGRLNYGEFDLKKKMSLNELIKALAKPSIAEGIKITIPEGYSAEMIAQRCDELGIVSSEDFLKELKEGNFDSHAFIKDIPDREGVKYKLQGYLFPSTYIFEKNANAHDVIDTMICEFEKQLGTVGKIPENMTVDEIVIRASLIEREAKLDSERVTISGVIQNRLDADMILQIDAAVVYAITDGRYDVTQVLYSDLEIDSPYNLYKHKGLPVGAICNPGIKSIRAAIIPEEHDYLYYHTDTVKNDGSHIFSETFAEHTN